MILGINFKTSPFAAPISLGKVSNQKYQHGIEEFFVSTLNILKPSKLRAIFQSDFQIVFSRFTVNSEVFELKLGTDVEHTLLYKVVHF